MFIALESSIYLAAPPGMPQKALGTVGSAQAAAGTGTGDNHDDDTVMTTLLIIWNPDPVE